MQHILKARKALKEVPDGGTLEIVATDPGAVADFQAFCRQTGNELLEHSEDDGIYQFLIKKTG
jgi:tRNA 2-thiouridine synthesizing protein A